MGKDKGNKKTEAAAPAPQGDQKAKQEAKKGGKKWFPVPRSWQNSLRWILCILLLKRISYSYF